MRNVTSKAIAEATDEARIMSQTRSQTIKKRRELLKRYVAVRAKLAAAEEILSKPTALGQNMADAFKRECDEIESAL